jgi:RNA polymerase sigma-70 factor (ECF subfamily)
MLHRLTLALPGPVWRRDACQDPLRRPAGLAAREDAGDTELMAWAGAGDRAAFDILVARHAERALRLALRVLGDATEAEDVAQEAFLRAWQAAPRFDPARARFTTWLHRIVLNLAIDRARRRGRMPQAGLDAAQELPDPAKGPEESLAEAEGRKALAAALEALPPRQRAAIALAYEEGLSGAAAAEALSISERALEGLLRRARQMLRARLDPGGKQ